MKRQLDDPHLLIFVDELPTGQMSYGITKWKLPHHDEYLIRATVLMCACALIKEQGFDELAEAVRGVAVLQVKASDELTALEDQLRDITSGSSDDLTNFGKGAPFDEDDDA